MFIYTYNDAKQKHLKMPVPVEWDMDDVDFFIKGKPHLSKEPITTVAKATPKAEPVAKEADKTPAVEAAPLPTVAISGCPKHPNYTGKRLGKSVKDCPTCRALYDREHSA